MCVVAKRGVSLHPPRLAIAPTHPTHTPYTHIRSPVFNFYLIAFVDSNCRSRIVLRLLFYSFVPCVFPILFHISAFYGASLSMWGLWGDRVTGHCVPGGSVRYVSPPLYVLLGSQAREFFFILRVFPLCDVSAAADGASFPFLLRSRLCEAFQNT